MHFSFCGYFYDIVKCRLLVQCVTMYKCISVSESCSCNNCEMLIADLRD